MPHIFGVTSLKMTSLIVTSLSYASHQEGPNKFALKTGIKNLNEIRLLEGEAQDSTMSWRELARAGASWRELAQAGVS